MGSRKRRRLWGGLAIGLSGMLALSGCTGTSVTTPEPSSATPPPAASEDSTPEVPDALSFTLPDCETMNTVAQQEYLDFGPEMFSEPAGETDFTTFDRLADPVAKDTMALAQSRAGCRWPVHSQGTVTQYVAEVSEADRAPLVEDLRANAVPFDIVGEARIFHSELPAENQMASVTKVTHIFLGDAWVVIFDYAGQREWGYPESAIAGLVVANPGLGEPQKAAPIDGRECSTLTGAEALTTWGAGVPAPIEGVTDYWDLTGDFSDVSGYDPCADLSWIVLRETPCCTRFSPTPILLFHRGDFVQLATEQAYALSSNTSDPIQRTSDQSISVFYMWQGEDGNAELAEIASSTFSWNERTRTVDRGGNLPPV